MPVGVKAQPGAATLSPQHSQPGSFSRGNVVQWNTERGSLTGLPSTSSLYRTEHIRATRLHSRAQTLVPLADKVREVSDGDISYNYMVTNIVILLCLPSPV